MWNCVVDHGGSVDVGGSGDGACIGACAGTSAGAGAGGCFDTSSVSVILFMLRVAYKEGSNVFFRTISCVLDKHAECEKASAIHVIANETTGPDQHPR